MPPLFFITGPTGAGKTEIAAAVADRCHGEIIGADAFQVYTGMDILTAKPPRELRQRIPHHLVDVISPAQNFDVAQYLNLAKQAVLEITARGRLPIVAGGTGLYVRALTHGLSELPGTDPELRANLQKCSLEELQNRIRELDPVCAAVIDLKNPRRLIRAIEVCELTGKPFSSLRNEWNKQPGRISGVFLTRDRDDLQARIDRRVLEMMRDGLLEEVRALPESGATASQAIGLRETRACLNGGISPDECAAQIQRATRQYAKRQITWFKRETAFEQVNLSTFSDQEQAVELIAEKAIEFSKSHPNL
jgi:tRNA dimethylallyltransferase